MLTRSLTRAEFDAETRAARTRKAAARYGETVAAQTPRAGDSAEAAPNDYAGVLLRVRDDGPYLLQARASRRGIAYPGRLSLFGGLKEGEESPEACVVRELREETGLEISTGRLVALGRIDCDDEAGRATRAHIFLADGFTRRALDDLQISEGDGVFVAPDRLARHAGRMTPFTLFALGAAEDRTRTIDAAAAPAMGFLARFLGR